MVFPYGFIDIIFKKDVLEAKGIIAEIIKEYKPGEMQIDDKLILVRCAMNFLDAGNMVQILKEKYGLIYEKDGKAEDFIIINGPHGPQIKCDWLKLTCLKEDAMINKIRYSRGTRFYEFVNWEVRMIIINDLSEMEKYKRVENQRGVADYVFYEFKENGVLCDVTINVKFAPSSDTLMNNFFNDFKELEDGNLGNVEVDFNYYIIRCKNIVINKDCFIDCVETENLSSSAYCFIETIKASGDVNAKKIDCLAIECNNINAGSLSCETMIADGDVTIDRLSVSKLNFKNNLKVKELIFNGSVMTNVTAMGDKVI